MMCIGTRGYKNFVTLNQLLVGGCVRCRPRIATHAQLNQIYLDSIDPWHHVCDVVSTRPFSYSQCVILKAGRGARGCERGYKQTIQ